MAETASKKPRRPGSRSTPPTSPKLAEAGEIELIDVRRDYEHEAGHIAGSRHIEMNDLTAKAGSIPKDRPVVFYCRGGSRSAMAAEAFSQAGFDAHNMTGGIERLGRAGAAARARGRRGRRTEAGLMEAGPHTATPAAAGRKTPQEAAASADPAREARGRPRLGRPARSQASDPLLRPRRRRRAGARRRHRRRRPRPRRRRTTRRRSPSSPSFATRSTRRRQSASDAAEDDLSDFDDRLVRDRVADRGASAPTRARPTASSRSSRTTSPTSATRSTRSQQTAEDAADAADARRRRRRTTRAVRRRPKRASFRPSTGAWSSPWPGRPRRPI